MYNDNIYYSQCWEDPRILLRALVIEQDDVVLSITSGGDNCLAILCEGVQQVVAIDINPAQNYLLELKCKAAQMLLYDEYLEFLGVNDSDRRKDLYKKICPTLSKIAKEWWSNHIDDIETGIIHCGRFDKYIRFFARYIIPLIHRKKTIQNFLNSSTVEDQWIFYNKIWSSLPWKFMFELATRKQLLMRARQHDMFSQTDNISTTKEYIRRLEKNISSIPLHDNFFLHYSLNGNYSSCLPPYLEKITFKRIAKTCAEERPCFSYVTSNLLTYLPTIPNNTFSKFNLSDIFESLSDDENVKIWDEIIRTAKSGARIVYWNNLIKRSYPSRISDHISTDKDLLDELRTKDRVYFYNAVYTHTIIK